MSLGNVMTDGDLIANSRGSSKELDRCLCRDGYCQALGMDRLITLEELDNACLSALRDGLELWCWMDMLDLEQGESSLTAERFDSILWKPWVKAGDLNG